MCQNSRHFKFAIDLQLQHLALSLTQERETDMVMSSKCGLFKTKIAKRDHYCSLFVNCYFFLD